MLLTCEENPYSPYRSTIYSTDMPWQLPESYPVGQMAPVGATPHGTYHIVLFKTELKSRRGLPVVTFNSIRKLHPHLSVLDIFYRGTQVGVLLEVRTTHSHFNETHVKINLSDEDPDYKNMEQYEAICSDDLLIFNSDNILLVLPANMANCDLPFLIKDNE